jgi:hypothetical protein
MKHLVTYCTIILCLMITGYFILAALGRPTDQLFPLLVTLLSNAVTGIIVLAKQKNTETKVDDIRDRVDGQMSALIQAKTISPDEEGSHGTTSVPPTR